MSDNNFQEKKTPLFSIVIPFYNSEKTLAGCVESVLNQECSDFELLLVDDGSVDGSYQIACKYAKLDSRVRVLQQANGGVSAARNLGIKNILGEWLVFADADDYVYPCWLSGFMLGFGKGNSLIVENVLLEQSEPSKSWLLYSEHVTAGRISIKEWSNLAPWGFPFNKCFNASTVKSQCFLFDESLHVYEDEVFIAEYCKSFSEVRYIDVMGYHYFAPNDFEGKYLKPERFSEFLYQYEQLHNKNNELADSVVNRLVINTIKINSMDPGMRKERVMELRSVLNKEIDHVRGRKLAPLKALRFLNCGIVWLLFFNIYACFIVKYL